MRTTTHHDGDQPPRIHCHHGTFETTDYSSDFGNHGLPVFHKHRKGQNIQYNYDLFNRLSTVDFLGTSLSETYTYDPVNGPHA
ncbi:MAG TPA: hypothetical protein VI893_03055 [Thermoplasmata archaeon]|nr:hypothetical protein [Thermoplasmata archaeon]